MNAPFDFSTRPVLETARLRLALLAREDAPGLLALLGDPEVSRRHDLPPPETLAEAETLIMDFTRRFEAGIGLHWKIARRDDPAGLIGTCGILTWQPWTRRAVVGYDVARPHWGQGYAGEALGAVLAWGFAHLGVARFEARVAPDNPASERVLARLGFRLEGEQEQPAVWTGGRRTVRLYALTRPE